MFVNENTKIPEISKQLYQEDINQILHNNFSEVGLDWIKHQMAWVEGSYKTFKDHEKFLIVIYLVKRTLDFYSRNFVKISFDDFFAKDQLEIEKFSIIEISKDLKMPKETARRKIVELEQGGAIKRQKKKIILDRSVFPFIKPTNTTKRISIFLSKFSEILKKHKVLDKKFDSSLIIKSITKNFSYSWKLFYELQIPIVLSWKRQFKDMETWQIWGICILNKSYYLELNNKSRTLSQYSKNIHKNQFGNGLSAMSISDMTSIPRATVVRKLKILIKNKYLIIDSKKRYHPNGKNLDLINSNVSISIQNLSVFVTKILNQSLNFKNN